MADIDTQASGAHDPIELDERNDSEGERAAYGSLVDDVNALVEDTRTYFEAEVNFQKTRALYTAHFVRDAAIYAMGAFGLLLLASLGLVVGLIIALAPLIGPFAAMGVVILFLLIGAGLLGYQALRRIKRVRRAFDSRRERRNRS